MKLFGSRSHQSTALSSVPAGSGNAAAPARLGDPIAQAMTPRNGRNAIWVGGVTFRLPENR